MLVSRWEHAVAEELDSCFIFVQTSTLARELNFLLPSTSKDMSFGGQHVYSKLVRRNCEAADVRRR